MNIFKFSRRHFKRNVYRPSSFSWFFIKKIPTKIIKKYNNKIINVHPSLLPKFGGKGMYGSNVHKTVLLNKETKSGVTFHFVNEEYDKGQIILKSSFN